MRTLLAHSSTPNNFLHHVLQHATYLHYITPSKLLQNKTSTSILFNRTPTYSHLRVFGCICFLLFPSITIHKLQHHSAPCIFLGYPTNHHGYKCYNPSTRKILFLVILFLTEHPSLFLQLKNLLHKHTISSQWTHTP
ncbi:putative RNA-directed DNA polymerase [Helianthus annuus]|nr:putative RNA-directed DNA polymerase [Helianthus annuus]KAJ0940872.1 putative RNA-directed DNA polymerase [Helianthus annuus]